MSKKKRVARRTVDSLRDHVDSFDQKIRNIEALQCRIERGFWVRVGLEDLEGKQLEVFMPSGSEQALSTLRIALAVEWDEANWFRALLDDHRIDYSHIPLPDPKVIRAMIGGVR